MPADDPKWGPAMKALPNDRWRAACLHFVHGSGQSGKNNYGYTDAIKAAGYEGTDGSLRVSAHHMFHDERMQRAIQEEGRKAMVGLVPLSRRAIEEIVQTPGHKDQLSAAKTILDRAGVHEVREEIVHHEVALSTEFQQRAVILAKRMGLPLEKLLGNRLADKIAPPVDAEFVEVKKPRGMEDIL